MTASQGQTLITGFAPFQGERINPSDILGRRLADQFGFDYLQLPVSYEGSFAVLKSSLETRKYRRYLALGQAGGRAQIGLERVALNMEDAEMADESQVIRLEHTIDKKGPHAVINPLPLREIVQKLKMQVGPIEISNSAGTFVCNSIYYKVFRWIETNPGVLEWQLFVHLPYLSEQVMGKDSATPYLAESVMEQGLSQILRELSQLSVKSIGRN